MARPNRQNGDSAAPLGFEPKLWAADRVRDTLGRVYEYFLARLASGRVTRGLRAA